MSANGKIDKLLAACRKLLPSAEQQQEAAEYDAWLDAVTAALDRLVSASPPELQAAVVARLEAALRRWCEDPEASLTEDGLLRWAASSLDRNAVPIPDALPAELLQAYLDDPSAQPFDECSDCGLPMPTCQHRKVSYFPSCPRCGGRTGPLGWFYALHDAMKRLPHDKAFPAICGQANTLEVLRAEGYEPGTKLSAWLGERGL